MQCKGEWESEHCPVCQKVVGISRDVKLDSETAERLKDLIYHPGEDITDQEQKQDDVKYRRFLENLLKESTEAQMESEFTHAKNNNGEEVKEEEEDSEIDE